MYILDLMFIIINYALVYKLLFGCTTLQTLCLSAAVLFYVMTRDKLNTEWDDNGAGINKGEPCVHIRN